MTIFKDSEENFRAKSNCRIVAANLAKPVQGEGGFVLIIALVVLVLLTVIGITATTMTTVELQIAGNDKVHKQTFYHADGGSEIGALMVEENVSCPKGFNVGAFDNDDPATFHRIGGVEIADGLLALDEVMSDLPGAPTQIEDVPGDGARSIRIPHDINAPLDTDPHTNIAIFGDTQFAAGSAIQMAAGYDGKGKGAGASGAYIAYDIHSQRRGIHNSETVLRVEWKHVIGQEGQCNY